MGEQEKLYPGWSEAVQEVMDEGVGGLEIPARVATSLEESGILTIYNLLYQSVNQLDAITHLGTKSLQAIKLALRRKGFRRVKGRQYDASEPLYMMYECCVPAVTDPSDLVSETQAVDDDFPELLTHKQALERVLAGLNDVKTHFGAKTKQREMLEWIIYYGETRLPEEDEDG